MAEEFDLVVVGSGVAASTVAYTCRAAGWSVAVVDAAPFGGTCALRGCDPKKVLRRGAEIVDAARRLRGKGIDDRGLRVDWPALMAFKRGFTDPVPEQREHGFAERGIVALRGTARFVDRATLAVGERRLRGRRIVIAAGAKARPLGVPGEELVTTSDAFLELERLPRRILFIGGGYIAFEFAHLAARADAEVTVLTRGARPLKAFDPELVDRLVGRTRDIGVAVHPNATVEAVERGDDGLRVRAAVAGGARRFEADLVVHGAGRVPALDGLDPQTGGVRTTRGGVEVNAYLQSTSNPRVYAAGDATATAGPPLTPVAALEGHAVATNLLEGNRETPDYAGVPSVVFTVPALARVGLLEAEAREQGLDYACTLHDMSGWYTARRVGEPCAAAKVLVENGSGRVLGAHLLGPESAELVNVFGLAMRLGLRRADLEKAVGAYPSAGSDLGYLV